MPPDPDRPNASRPEASPKLVLGAGWGFPVVRDPERLLAVAAEDESVRQSILIILRTVKGERVMRPDFGCGLRRYLMQPNNPATRAAIQREIMQSLTRWEPRVKLIDIAVTPTDDRAMVLIEIHYAHVLDARQDVLVYPFYLEHDR